MPLYIDRHDLADATAADVAVAHMRSFGHGSASYLTIPRERWR